MFKEITPRIIDTVKQKTPIIILVIPKTPPSLSPISSALASLNKSYPNFEINKLRRINIIPKQAKNKNRQKKIAIKFVNIYLSP